MGESFTADTEVLEKANIPSVESMIMLYRLRWSGHLVRLTDVRLPKQFLYGQLDQGKRLQGWTKRRYKDLLKESLSNTGP